MLWRIHHCILYHLALESPASLRKKCHTFHCLVSPNPGYMGCDASVRCLCLKQNTGIKSLNCTNQVNVRCCQATAVYHSAKALEQCFIPHVWCKSWLETCPHCHDCCNLLTFPSQILLSTKGAPLLCNGFLGCNHVNCLLFTVLPINTPPFVDELTESLSNQENSKKPIKRVNALQLDTH